MTTTTTKKKRKEKKKKRKKERKKDSTRNFRHETLGVESRPKSHCAYGNAAVAPWWRRRATCGPDPSTRL